MESFMTEPPDGMPPIDDALGDDEDRGVGLRSLSVGHEGAVDGSEEEGRRKVKRRGRARKKEGKVKAYTCSVPL